MTPKILGEPNADYHANPAISHSKLKAFIESRLGFYERYITKTVSKESAAHFDIGSAFHLFMEGGLPFYNAISVNTKFDSWRTNEAKAWKAEQEKSGKIVLGQEEFKAVETMGSRVKAHKLVQELINGTEAEVTWRKSFGKWAVQARLDRYKPGVIVDWKTVPSIADFKRNAINYSYHTQAVFYQEVVAACLDYAPETPRDDMVFVAVEKEPPHEVQPFRFDAQALEVARAEVMVALRDMRHCFETGEWMRPEIIDSVSLPYWYVKAAETKLLSVQERLQIQA